MRFLYHQRTFLIRKAEGLSEEQARMAACPPSDLTMLGLIRHSAEVERNWALRSFAGKQTEPLYMAEAHPDNDQDGDFHPPSDATLHEAIATFKSEATAADAIYERAASLDDIEKRDRNFYSLRWILIHLIEEYSRHCGHADLIREAIDGETGE